MKKVMEANQVQMRKWKLAPFNFKNKINILMLKNLDKTK